MRREKTRQLLLDVSKNLFLKYGFRKVSVGDICKEANISGKTFYTYFNNKYDLVIAFLEDYFTLIESQFATIMRSEQSFEQKMVETAKYKLEHVELMSIECYKDLCDPTQTIIQDYFTKRTVHSVELSRKLFKEQQDLGQIRQDIDIELILNWLNFQSELFKQPDFISHFSDLKEMLEKGTALILYGIIGKN